MPREPIPRRAKAVKKAPSDYMALVQPSFKPTQVVGQRKKEEEAKKKADEAAKIAATPKKKLTAKQKAGKPTYAKMIATALIILQDRSGSSAAAISKQVEAEYGKFLPDNFKIFLRRALKNAVEDNILRHEGARYRLSKSGKYKLGLKKRKVKKAKKSSSSSSSSSKDKKRSSRSKSPSRSSSRSRSQSPSKKSKKKKTDTKKGDTKSKKASSSKAKEAKGTRSSTRRSESSSSSSSSSTSAPKKTPAGYDHVWHFQENGQWKPYDANASDVVEKAYLDYKKNPGMCDVRAVKSGQWQYQVDFLNNKQTNIQHENHTTRSIRRMPL